MSCNRFSSQLASNTAAIHAAMQAGTAADLAVLAPVDTVRGLRPGDPCEATRSLAGATGARLPSCIL